MLPIDPSADRGRRAWLPCCRCNHGARCSDCRSAKNCATHWQYLLSNEGMLVHLQCPDCGHLSSIDTREGSRRQSDAA